MRKRKDVPSQPAARDLPRKIERLAAAQANEYQRASEMFTSGDFPLHRHHSCGAKCSLLRELSITKTSERGKATAVYEDCPRCHPLKAVKERCRNTGIPEFEFLGKYGQNGAFTLAADFARDAKYAAPIVRESDERKAKQAFILRNPNGWAIDMIAATETQLHKAREYEQAVLLLNATDVAESLAAAREKDSLKTWICS